MITEYYIYKANGEYDVLVQSEKIAEEVLSTLKLDVDWILISERKLSKKEYNVLYEVIRNPGELE